MKFGRMLKYDLRYGTVRRFGYYLLPLLLGVADAVRQVLNYYKVRNPGTLLDHWLIMTAGTQPYQPNTLHSYKFPTIWLIHAGIYASGGKRIYIRGSGRAWQRHDREEPVTCRLVAVKMCLVYVQHTACLCDLLHTDVSYLCMARYPDENASDQASRHHVGGRILKLEDGRCVCRGSVYSGCSDDVSVSVTDAVRSSLVAGSGNHTVVGDTGNFGV